MVRKLAVLAGLVTAGSLGCYGLGTAGEAPAERPASSAAGCAQQAWPYLDRACLSAAEGTPARGPVRTIGVGRR